jgi:Caspase domain
VDQDGKELQWFIVLQCIYSSLLASYLLDFLFTGDEEDGYDETLIPVDFQQHGQIRDDDLLRILVKPMKEGVTMTCLMDCCHSGTVLDLPYRFTADGDKMVRQNNIDFGKLMGSPEALIACGCCLFYLISMLADF